MKGGETLIYASQAFSDFGQKVWVLSIESPCFSFKGNKALIVVNVEMLSSLFQPWMSVVKLGGFWFPKCQGSICWGNFEAAPKLIRVDEWLSFDFRGC